jgi:hypothetical protein
MLLFRELGDEIQMPTSLEATSYHSSVQEYSQSFYPSEPFRIPHFTIRHHAFQNKENIMLRDDERLIEHFYFLLTDSDI